MDDFAKYDALAGSIDAEDVASDERNARILRRIMENDPELRGLSFGHTHDGYCYCPANAREMGWLGYFLGKSTNTNFELGLDSEFGCERISSEIMDPFFRGVSRGRSVGELELQRIEGGDLLRMWGPFFENIVSLTLFSAFECNFGDEGCRQLSLALRSCTKSSLTTVCIHDCEISDDQFGDIAIALSMHPKLKTLSLMGNCIGRNGCAALAALLRYSAVELECLGLDNNDLDDEAVETLMSGLANCKKMKHLAFGNNSAISVNGWRELSQLLNDQNCALKTLRLNGNGYSEGNRIDDETVIAFASVLATNQSLRTLAIVDRNYPARARNSVISEQGWNAVSTLLCDTSSVNKTFLSNHTLRDMGIGSGSAIPGDVMTLLAINNGHEEETEIALMKILMYHEDLSMQTFFEWDFKVLPLAIDWFERAAALDDTTPGQGCGWAGNPNRPGIPWVQDTTGRNIQPRKLSAIYQFVRGMPQLYVESHLRGELDEIQRNDLTMEQERLALAYRSQALERRKRESGKRKRDVVARLRSG